MKKILLGLTGSLLLAMTAQAELIDNSSIRTTMSSGMESIEQQTTLPQYAEGRWRRRPTFDTRSLYRLHDRLSICDCDAQGQPLANCQPQKITMVADMIVSPEGDVERVNISESSGEPYFDRIVMRGLRQAKLYPFIKDGQQVQGRITVPITHPYNPRMSHSCYELRQSLQGNQSTE
ncbi:energy transducer TonB [Psychrobacter sp. I-STPA6b]|uniref:energy transducer TonB n=1 Tax=Psychrobacter sp. I-STPA6b TaxID=2585718 RepID=UPI001D0C5BA8|nr:energy transducer TonB [Psychrobacter sp. I-STPA6b]